ncbi:hypothetical protein LX16_3844 [Stackebrandtia albiflava]|uniref:DUF6286 domain-containing protein n=1 Tax=Stackebrandtia albiflava TaxID=406432 RepID=A0A562UXY5_9ACTN|nr:DUF6286 domain-containing protein [Stackebrandtia albiflava]TWJ10428.1 hypothetical protein LX16_3844 [Stackebrandtia albiflava]
MRTFNRLASMLLGLALAALGIVIGLEAVMVIAGADPVLIPGSRWYRSLTGTGFDSPVVLYAGIAAIVVGLVVLFLELRPWRPVRMATSVDEDWYVQRRGLERGVAGAVDQVPGVTGARAKVSKRWRCQVTASGDPDSRDDVRSAVDDELTRLGAPEGRRVRVRLHRLRRVT